MRSHLVTAYATTPKTSALTSSFLDRKPFLSPGYKIRANIASYSRLEELATRSTKCLRECPALVRTANSFASWIKDSMLYRTGNQSSVLSEVYNVLLSVANASRRRSKSGSSSRRAEHAFSESRRSANDCNEGLMCASRWKAATRAVRA